MKISSLEMYNRAETQKAHQELYQNIVKELKIRGIEAPAVLSKNRETIEFWGSNELFLSQTCGLPYRLFLHNKVTLVGTPDYGLKGFKPGHYASVIIVRKEDKIKSLTDFSSSIFAYNDILSQSGWAAPQKYFKELKINIDKIKLSGSHRASAKLVSEGQADIAAIDAISFKLIKEYDNFSSNLSIIAQTKSTPGLPIIAHKNANQTLFFDSIETAIDQLQPPTKKILHLKGIVKTRKSDYLNIKVNS